MAKIGEDFDANSVEPTKAFDPLPPEWFAMNIAQADVRPNKNDPRFSHIWLELEVDEARHPAFKGRKVWEQINKWHENAQTVEIANRTLSAICRAVGVMNLTDTDQLVGKKLAVKLKVEPATAQYEAKNKISAYDAIAARFGGGSAPAAPHQQAPASTAAPAQTAAPTGGKPPWQR